MNQNDNMKERLGLVSGTFGHSKKIIRLLLKKCTYLVTKGFYTD
jgi:hypothetical protein